MYMYSIYIFFSFVITQRHPNSLAVFLVSVATAGGWLEKMRTKEFCYFKPAEVLTRTESFERPYRMSSNEGFYQTSHAFNIIPPPH